MKRSEINKLIDEGIGFFDRHQFRLPHWAYWTVEDWRVSGDESAEVRTHGMGWNVTDFGDGDFNARGLLLFILRNGRLEGGRPATSKSYCEKAMMVRPGQVTPWHFHWAKTEDLINRGGGRLEVELGWASEDEKGITKKDVIVQLDGISKRISAGGKLTLEPGQSVTLPPRLCHQFTGHPNDHAICVGEISSLNDDLTDNCFIYGCGHRTIEEDSPAKYWLCSEYPPLHRKSGEWTTTLPKGG